MTTLREAAQMALEALELVDGYVMGKHEAKEALYEALAQPEQVISQEWKPANSDAKLIHYALVLRDLDKTIEGWCEQPEFYLDGKRIDAAQPELEPVACPYCHYSHTLGAVFFDQNCAGCVNRMTTPPQRGWQGLTDEEMRGVWDDHVVPMFGRKHMNPIVFGRIIEAKLKEKNT